jgi:hypothetical protein
MILFILSAVAVVLGGLFAFLTGLFDRPKFVYREFLLESKKELYVLMAPCKENGFAKHMPRICQGTLDAVQALKGSTKLLADGAALYGSPKGAERLFIGLFFDDPWLTNTPRWAIGWVVDVKDFAEAKTLAEEANKTKPAKLTEPIVAVRVGPGPGIAGRLPWRTMLTPRMAPMVQWARAFAAYRKGGYKSHGREGEEGSVACEVYVTGPNDSYEYIDYIVLMGDTRNVWDDTFPVEK